MTDISAIMLEYSQKLENRITLLNRICNLAPEGHLVIRSRNNSQYYSQRVTRNSLRSEKYLSVKESADIIQLLASKKYAKNVLPVLNKNLAAAKAFLSNYSGSDEEEIASTLDPFILDLNKDLYITREQKINNWLSQKWSEHPPEGDPPVHPTLAGFMVRSKSEEFIANRLYHHGLTFLYEKPIYLDNMSYPHFPDFTIFDPISEKESYWEHFGKMDDPTYVQKMTRKLQTYQRNDIIIGINLVCTFESKAAPFTSIDAEKVITNMFLRPAACTFTP